MQKVSVTVLNEEECKKIYSTESPVPMTSDMLCAGDRGKNSCMVNFNSINQNVENTIKLTCEIVLVF